MSLVRVLWSSSRIMAYIWKAGSYTSRSPFHLPLVRRPFDRFRQLLHIVDSLCLPIRHIVVQPITPPREYHPNLRRSPGCQDLWLSVVLDLPCRPRPRCLLFQPYNQSLSDFRESQVSRSFPLSISIILFLALFHYVHPVISYTILFL